MDLPPISRPAVGDPVAQLWKHVNALATVVEAQRRQLAVLDARRPRRPMDVTGGGGDWRFVPIESIANLDSGSVDCIIDGETVSVAIPAILATLNAPSAEHVRLPEYEVGDWIFAIFTVTDTEGGGKEWVEVGSDRQWALDLEVCIDDVPYHGLIVCGALEPV
jgi:hypothetical protein